MNNGKIVTNISGGHVNIGNISQGNNNRNIAGAQSISSDSAFAAFFESLNGIAATGRHPDAEVAALRGEIADLQQSMQRGVPTKDSFLDKARRLYEKYGWAAEPLKKLLAVLVPGLAL
jgi:hypothetical protein